MLAARLRGTVTKDYRLKVTIPRSVPPGDVEVILLQPEGEAKGRRRRTLRASAHPAAGMWADRSDLGDTVAFVTQLRRRLERRHDARP